MIQPIIDYDISEHRYFIDPVNSQDNERIVELRLAIDWYEELCGLDRKQNIVEVGNVLGFYGYSEHLCVDKFAESPDISPAGEVVNLDALEVDFTGKDVVSVSTLEHIGTDDYNNPNANEGEDAVDVLKKIEEEANSYFLTFGPNYNNPLDNFIKENLEKYDWHGWIRTDKGRWRYSDQDIEVWEKVPDDPYPFANGIILLQRSIQES